MNHSKAILQFCEEVFNEKICMGLCRKHKFIERSSSKLKGYEFINVMVVPSEGLSTESLLGLCKRFKQFNPEADLSAQALCERINHVSARDLMKGVFEKILSTLHSKQFERCSQLDKALEYFNAVLIEDSTVIKLNEKLKNDFKGTNRGGKGAKSQVKIDLIYDIMQGAMVDAAIYSGNEPDQGLSHKILQYIQLDDLVIRDLGYFVLDTLKTIADIGAFYLSRLQPNVKVFLEEHGDEIDLGRYVDKYYRGHGIIDLGKVFLGDKKISARIVLYRQPKEVVEKEQEQRIREPKRQGGN